MSWSVKSYILSFLPSEKHERTKWGLLAIAFFLMIASYTLIRELKDSLFIAIVGDKSYIPLAKLIALFVLVPAILLYSKLVDRLQRYRLLSYYCMFYGIVGLLFALLLGHETIGLPNTQGSPWRIFGWIFYMFVEGYGPFIVGLFWSFVNSISSPDDAKNNYSFMVAASKFGGMLSAAFAWYMLSVPSGHYLDMSSIVKHQVLLALSSALLVFIPFIVVLLMKKVSGKYLHGYEAVYKVEKKKDKDDAVHAGSGLMMLLRTPYAFGIFLISMFYELVYSVLSYQRVAIAQEGGASCADMSAYFYKIMFITHTVGFLISLFGTKFLLKKFGEKNCLMFIPVAIALLFAKFKLSGRGKDDFAQMYVGLRAIHYGFSYPVRESLYIPTVKELKFKTKSWIDAFGSKFSKSNGQLFNYMTKGLSAAGFAIAQDLFFCSILCMWVGVSFLLGRRFEKAVLNKEVIGANGND